MGTVLLDEFSPRRYVKRFYGGKDRGVCYSVKIEDAFDATELAKLVGELTAILLHPF